MVAWYIFAFLSVAFSVFYGLISKKLLNDKNDHNPIAFASALFATVAIISLITYLLTNPDIQSDVTAFTNRDTLWLFGASMIMYSIAPSFYWRALKKLPASEVSILYDLTTVYIFIFGVMVGTESFSATRMMGGIFIVGAVLILGFSNAKKNKFKVNRYFWMLMAATFFYAMAALIDNIVISQGRFSPLFFQALTFGIPSLLILLINKKAIEHLKYVYHPKVYKYILINAVFFFASFWAIYKAYEVGGVTSEVNFVASTETILTVVLASVLLKEKENLWIKVFCSILAGIGIFLLI
jgi:drug/metabolite transporter (DMT)-like permease